MSVYGLRINWTIKAATVIGRRHGIAQDVTGKHAQGYTQNDQLGTLDQEVSSHAASLHSQRRFIYCRGTSQRPPVFAVRQWGLIRLLKCPLIGYDIAWTSRNGRKITQVDRTPATTADLQPRKKERLFPLHMTSFEHYMFVDDRPLYPMTFIVELEFDGELDRGALEQAVRASLQRHPLLAAVIGPGKGGKDCWTKAPNPCPLMDWAALDQPIKFPQGEFIDLRKEIGLRLFIRHNEQRTVLTTQFHHAVCDGIGSYQYLGDLMYEYAIRTGGSDLANPAELPIKRLKERGRVSYDLNNFRTADGQLQKTWDESLKFLVRSNVSLKPEKRKPPGFRESFPGIASYEFDKDQYKQLRLAAQSNGQIVNDMLVEKLFATLFEWDRHTSSWFRRRHVCVMMPMNLREPSDNNISACNVVVQSFVRRSRADLRHPRQFRNGLGNELLKIKHERNRIRFMHMIAGGHYFYPKTLKACLDFKKNLATAILSNTGDPTKQFLVNFPKEKGLLKCGDVLLTDISGVPPMRPGTNATISIFTYRRVLKICMRCDPNQFSQSDTQRLLQMYVKNIREDLAG